ncbi:MAG: M48 family metallopeptidase [Fimbriimonadaceae bacterium]|jgi:Zn-dependent protease with chaperone function|nr:M48 family metallopeptidase [Fimbriimonadaceae bacterium]
MERKRFPGLTKEAFVADTDQKALDSLKKIPLLPTVVQKFYEHGFDRWIYCWNMAMSVRCSPTQYKTIYEINRECCAILDMPEPEIYLTGNPFPNAFAGGVERPYIVLRSSIIDTLNDEELFHLIGHELGHIKSGHILYFSVATVLIPIMELIARRTFGLGDAAQVALYAAFFEWMRQAEISADRAGLLCAQDFQLSARSNLMLTSGPNRLAHESSVEAFQDQARMYQDMDFFDSIGKLLISLNYSLWASHPMPVHRTQELEKWFLHGGYERILKGNYIREQVG